MSNKNKIAKSMAARINWANYYLAVSAIGNDPNKNNAIGFSALASGLRTDDGDFWLQYYGCYWYSITEYDASEAITRNLYYSNSSLLRELDYKRNGYSVRLVRN